MNSFFCSIELTYYRIVGFSRYLNFANGRFSVFSRFHFHKSACKSSALLWVVCFFEGLNFTNDQHPRNSRNLRTSKKPTIWYSTPFLYEVMVNWSGFNVVSTNSSNAYVYKHVCSPNDGSKNQLNYFSTLLMP